MSTAPLTVLGEEEEIFRTTVREFAEQEIAPCVERMDRAGQYDPDIVPKLFDLGVMAIETPELATGEKFGIRIGWGGFDSFESNANAVGASAIGVLGRNYFREGDRLAVDAGVGLGWSEFKDYNQSRVLAGRVGLQFTW